MKKILLHTVFIFICNSLQALETVVHKDGDDKFFDKQIRLLSYGSVEEKISAIYNLRAVRSKRALRPFVLALRGVSSLTSKQTKSQTQEINPDGEYAYINFEIKQNNKPVVKYLAAQGLAEIRHDFSIPHLIETYKELNAFSEKNKNQRIFYEHFEEMPEIIAQGEVLKSLGTLLADHESKEAQELINQALNHEHYFVRSAAAEALSNTDSDTAIPTLDGAVAKEKNDYAKASMHAAIVDIRKTNTKHFFALVEMLKNPSSIVRLKVSALLGILAIENSETYIRQAMMIEENVAVKNQMKKDIVLITTYEVPNAPSASYGVDIDRNKKSDSIK